jgi:hypothetical protein
MADFFKLRAAQHAFLCVCSLKDSLQQIKELGFRYIEWMTTPPQFWLPRITAEQRQDFRK